MSCDHEWVVFSTCVDDGVLMLGCVECHALGVVEAPSKEEWAAAFHAPSSPYRWEDGGRVRLVREGPAAKGYVQKTPEGYAPGTRWHFIQEMFGLTGDDPPEWSAEWSDWWKGGGS